MGAASSPVPLLSVEAEHVQVPIDEARSTPTLRSMRPSCLFCATKHLSQALILLSESLQGYPAHRWLAYGHMAEASDELIQNYPQLADLIREERKRLEQAPIEAGRLTSIMLLLTHVTTQMEPDAPATPLIADRVISTPPPVAQPVFTVEDAAGKRELVVSTPPMPGCGGCAAKAAAMKAQLEAEQAAKELAEREATLTADNAEVIEPGYADGNPERRDTGQLAQYAVGANVSGSNTFASPKPKTQVIILTTLADFAPSYSLTTCIKDQALALANAGYGVRLIVQEHARFSPTDVHGVSIEPTFPSCVWKEDEIVPESVDEILSFLRNLLTNEPTIIISHDLLFQSWFVSAAKAIHLFTQQFGTLNASWFHVAHSSVGVRPQLASDPSNAIHWRTNVPQGHQLVCLNEADRLWFDNWYGVVPGHTQVVKNIRDPRTAWSMRPELQSFVTHHQLLSAEVVCLFPLSLPRWKEKGLLDALGFFARVKANGMHTHVRFIIAAAHANDPNQRRAFDDVVDERMRSLGLTYDEVVRTYRDFEQEAGSGLGQVDMDTLWRLTNLFIFPSVSEAGSLVLLEAQAAGCVLVLNRSVRAFGSYVDANAVWVTWGSQKEPLVRNPSWEVDVLGAARSASLLLAQRPGRKLGCWEDLASWWGTLFERASEG